MGQHGGTGQRPVLATCFGFLLCSTLTLFLQNFELRNFPQTTNVSFILFSTSLIPFTRTINCFPTTQPPTQDTPPFWAPPEAHHSILIVTKSSLTQFFSLRPFGIDLLLGFSPWPILWQKWLDQMSDFGSQVSTTTILKPHSFPAALEPILTYPEHPLAPWAPTWRKLACGSIKSSSPRLGHRGLSSFRFSMFPNLATQPLKPVPPHGVKPYPPWPSIGLNVLHLRNFVAL